MEKHRTLVSFKINYIYDKNKINTFFKFQIVKNRKISLKIKSNGH